jgi:hypothetical protein
MSGRVFITYAHENLAHERRVLKFANELRAGGVDAEIDQYEPHPAEGWTKWMEHQFSTSDAILVVPSQMYLTRYRQDSGIGTGARFEAAILSNILARRCFFREDCCGVGRRYG